MTKSTICSVDGCDKGGRLRKGLCGMHYERQRTQGSVGEARPRRFNGEDITGWMLGVIQSEWPEACIKWPFSSYENGYGSVYDPDGRHTVASRLMCRFAHGEPDDESMDCAHSCGKGHEGCVNPRHLSWKTRQGNMADKIEHGTALRGEQHTQSKLSDSEVREIRALYEEKVPLLDIASHYGISFQHASDIGRRVKWGWME